MIKKIRAWAIVNKDFERLYAVNPALVSSDVFFTKYQAEDEFERRLPFKFCSDCGAKKKRGESHLKIIEIKIEI